MSKIDKTYHQLLKTIMTDGYTYEDPNRKNVNRLEIPSYTFRHEFKDGFPAITTKKLHYKNVVTELIWFLRGDTNIKYLVDNGCNIWNKDAYNYSIENKKEQSIEDFIKGVKSGGLIGNIGKGYGHQWRNFNGVDQIQRLITNLKEKPLATDHIVNSWNVGDLPDMALPPCHYGFQIVVRPLYLSDFGKLRFIYDYNNPIKYGFELHWTQRSSDSFLGIPYNIASYATLALILEKITSYKALAIQGDLKKVHLYDNSLDAVKEQLSRDVDKYSNTELYMLDEFHYMTNKELVGELPIDKIINELRPDMFKLNDYESYPVINVKMLERDE
jgi:thymidylate synthase